MRLLTSIRAKGPVNMRRMLIIAAVVGAASTQLNLEVIRAHRKLATVRAR